MDPRVEFFIRRTKRGPIQIADKVLGSPSLRESHAFGKVQIKHRPIARAEHGGLKHGWEKAIGVHRLAGFQGALRIRNDNRGGKRIAFRAESVRDP